MYTNSKQQTAQQQPTNLFKLTHLKLTWADSRDICVASRMLATRMRMDDSDL